MSNVSGTMVAAFVLVVMAVGYVVAVSLGHSLPATYNDVFFGLAGSFTTHVGAKLSLGSQNSVPKSDANSAAVKDGPPGVTL